MEVEAPRTKKAIARTILENKLDDGILKKMGYLLF